MEILIMLSLMFLDEIIPCLNNELHDQPQYEVSYFSENKKSSILSNILDSLHNKKLVSILRSNSPLNYIPEPFSINIKKDTLIVKITHNSFRIFSSSNNTSLWRIKDYVEDVRYYRSNNSTYNFYENLLLKWDIDSLDILCLYDTREYEVTPNDTVYRFIIKNGEITRIDSHIFHATPALPDRYVDFTEKMRRIEIRQSLMVQDNKKYQRLFVKKKQHSLIEKIKERLDQILHHD